MQLSQSQLRVFFEKGMNIGVEPTQLSIKGNKPDWKKRVPRISYLLIVSLQICSSAFYAGHANLEQK